MAGILWKDLKSGDSVLVSTHNIGCNTLLIGHEYYGFAFYSLRQYEEAIYIGGVAPNLIGIEISISASNTIINNKGNLLLRYKFL